jgi:hypothetical protein
MKILGQISVEINRGPLSSAELAPLFSDLGERMPGARL